MIGNRKLRLARPRVVAALGLALTCGLLSATSALADKGGKKHPPQPPQPPAGWDVAILQPSGDYYWSVAYGASGDQQAGYAIIIGGDYHAGVWSGTAASWVDLNPPWWAYDSWAYGTSGDQQVGCVGSANPHAVLWSGTPESCVDLHPAGRWSSCAYGVGDGQQVGEVDSHASLWNGTAESWVDLNPSGSDYPYSRAYAAAGGQQVGYAGLHAGVWNGTAESWVDLNPKTAKMSTAWDVSDGQQVGSAYYSQGGGTTHAGLWSGTAESWVDLHPAGYDGSEAYGVSHGYQAGSAWSPYVFGELWHAGIWNGTPESWVDLSTLLPPAYEDVSDSSARLNPEGYGDTCAEDIEVTDTDIWVVGWASDYYGLTHAVLWHKKPSQ